MFDIADLLGGGGSSPIPQAVLAVLALAEGAGSVEDARAFALQYAAVALCENRRGDDGCPSCSCWNEGAHPDMVLAGRWEKAPGIEECLAFQAALHLRPFAAPGRLGIVPVADTMSLPAANSLLKIVEEPPEGARLLLLSQSEDVIPTLRSRMWVWRPGGTTDRGVIAAAPPQSPLEWASWLERTKKFSLADLDPEVRGWGAWFSEAGEWRTAASLENLLTLAINRHMPVSMIQDAVYALLREGASVEQIFGYVREA